jgi:hypothetical protein
MGSKYQPSIKDQKASQRFHKNVRLKIASGPVRQSRFLPQTPINNLPKSGTETPSSGQSDGR